MFYSREISRTLPVRETYDGAGLAGSDAPLRFGILVDGHCLASAQPQGMAHALAKDGHSVIHLNPQAALADFKSSLWLAGIDLLIARGHSAGLLARLSAAEAAGVPTLNRHNAIAAVIDPTQMAARLRAAGIPTPPTRIGTAEQTLRVISRPAHLLTHHPVHGEHCPGIRVARTRRALDAAARIEPRIVAQRQLPNSGIAVRLNVIGNRVWAIRQSCALRSADAAAVLVTLPFAWRDLARRCGELFGLQLFGADCIESGGALRVVGIKDFPDFSGVPDADAMLAAHAVQYAQIRRDVRRAAS
jgi:ribosomal protein S6--L-glutamate ligase